ncbi:MAG: DNA polymerase III subunit alpha [Oscillospiraceae bacterium]|nr:DNA polymerase III subunit alpha [Oscillospiraceae bacterium]
MFTELHVHTEYSLLTGACRIRELVSRAKALGQRAVAVTDINNMFAAAAFYKECVKQGIKPVVGCELSVRSAGTSGSIVLLCRTDEGYANLIRLVSDSYRSCDGLTLPEEPYITFDMLKGHTQGLICLSGGTDGELARAYNSSGERAALAVLDRYRSLFGTDYYVEINDHRTPADNVFIPLAALASRKGIPLAASNNVYYTQKEDAATQRILRAIDENTETADIRNALPCDEYYLKSEEQMRSIFAAFPQAVDNTALIADSITFEMSFGHYKLPHYEQSPKDKEVYGGDNVRLFRDMCRKGLEEKYPDTFTSLLPRLEYELDTVISMGYTDYYLIVWDFVRFSRENDIPVGPGRGSGAGSLAAYCIGITDVDPIKYGLIFERFLNPERVSMPDFDIDFCYERRGEVIDYVTRKYGSDRVAQIITFTTMQAKAAVRDVTRILKLPLSLGGQISDAIKYDHEGTLRETAEKDETLSQLYRSDPNVRRIIDTAARIEGMPRNISVHAAGVVICDAPVSNYVPTIKKDGQLIAQYTMTLLEEVGLLKMDFLGLRNLTVIHDAAQYVRKKVPDFDVRHLPDGDKKTYDMLCAGDTFGVFQFESAGMTSLLTKLKPRSIEDLTAALSLYRPGPMDSIPRYLHNREHPEGITYLHPRLEKILSVTYGCIVYQEQVMEICRELAGYSYGRADLVRRAMSKKKPEVMEKERPAFIAGCNANGVDSKTAETLFDELVKFASYAFNKSHACAYSVIAYTTAYLKAHYFKEYMAALMSAFAGLGGKITDYADRCKSRGVAMLCPDVNENHYGFLPVAKGIRFSLMSVKNVGGSVISAIISERERGGRYKSLEDFISRTAGKINIRSIESLIKCGALDGLGETRRTCIENYQKLYELYSVPTGAIEGQLDLFGDSTATESIDIHRSPEYDPAKLQAMEQDITGIALSVEPSADMTLMSRICGIPLLAQERGTSPVHTFLAALSEKKEITTKNGEAMAFVTLTDGSVQTEAILFPKAYTQFAHELKKGVLCVFTGEMTKSTRDKLSITRIVPFDSHCAQGKLYIRIAGSDRDISRKCVEILKQYPGRNEVFFVLSDLSKVVRSNAVTGCRPGAKLFTELSDLCGEDNIRLVR